MRALIPQWDDSFSLQLCQIGIIVPILQIRKLGLRKVGSFAQDHIAGK